MASGSPEFSIEASGFRTERLSAALWGGGSTAVTQLASRRPCINRKKTGRKSRTEASNGHYKPRSQIQLLQEQPYKPRIPQGPYPQLHPSR